MKKLHWTQTPEGRKIMAQRTKNRVRTPSPQVTNDEVSEAVFAYALGHVESWLDTYAKSAGIPAGALTARVGKVLQSKVSR